ncbi:MAG: hypothetical protein KJ709_00550 [Nanoarchaeota archaeon]|nr:hypothetical protein [Nanoarchaeota archaeon]
MGKDEEKPKEQEIGKVDHYYSKIGVAVIELSGELKVGEEIHIKGATSDFKQNVESIQIEHDKLEEAKAGQSIGLKVKEPVRQNDKVFKVPQHL